MRAHQFTPSSKAADAASLISRPVSGGGPYTGSTASYTVTLLATRVARTFHTHCQKVPGIPLHAESFLAELPNQTERESIWAIQIQKYGRSAKDHDLVQLAKASEGFTGSEVENVFVDALFQAFEASREPADLTIAKVLNDFLPLSKLMAEQITGLRNWATGRARSKTTLESVYSADEARLPDDDFPMLMFTTG